MAGMIFGRQIHAPGLGEVHAVGVADGHAVDRGGELAAGAGRTEEVDRRVGRRVLGRHLPHQLVVDGQPRRIVLGPRRAVGLLALVRARGGQEHHVRPGRRHQLEACSSWLFT